MSSELSREELTDPTTGSRTIAIGRGLTFTCDGCGASTTVPTPCPDGAAGWGHEDRYTAEAADYCPDCSRGDARRPS